MVCERMMCTQQHEDKTLLHHIYPYVFHNDYLVRQAACRAIPAIIPLSSVRDHLKIVVNDLLSEQQQQQQQQQQFQATTATATAIAMDGDGDGDGDGKENRESNTLWKLCQLELVSICIYSFIIIIVTTVTNSSNE